MSATNAWGDSPVPQTHVWEGGRLAAIARGELPDDRHVTRALEDLRRRADGALQREPYSVVDNGVPAASGDPHDYTSYGTYWWPNPQTNDGLPFVRRDGQTNAEQIAKGDRNALRNLERDVVDLALAGYFFAEPKFSQHAAKMLRTWFLLEQTRMNPNLKHSQIIRGRNTGRYIGLIDTKDLVWVAEAAQVLRRSDAWNEAEHIALQAWFRDYLSWLQEHPFGMKEGQTRNNHAVYYDYQVAGFALFVGDVETARTTLQQAKSRRIDAQIEPDGRQPEEIARTRSLSYSFGNFKGMCFLARLGEHVDVDLWNYQGADGSSIRAAYEFLLPYLLTPQRWPHEQITPVERPWTGIACYLCATRYREPEYLAPAHDSDGDAKPDDLSLLVVSPE